MYAVRLLREIFLARTLGSIAVSSCRVSSPPRDQICVSCISCLAGGFFTTEPPGKPPVQRPPQLVLRGVCVPESFCAPFPPPLSTRCLQSAISRFHVECSVPLPVPFPFCLMRSESGKHKILSGAFPEASDLSFLCSVLVLSIHCSVFMPYCTVWF